MCLTETSRGVALYGGRVYFAAGEAVLVALDAKTGKEIWTAPVADNKSGYYITLAPLIADGKIMVGASGGEFGIRGFVAAFDPESGKELWRTYTIPAPGEPGSETWPKGDQWKTGGGSVWVTGNYDPSTNVAFWESETAARGWATSVPATIFTPLRSSRSTPPPAKSRATFNTIPTIPGIGMRFRLPSWWTFSAAGAPLRA